MSALRIAHPNHPVVLVDLGPSTWVPLHGTATHHGHAVQFRSGCIARPASVDTAIGDRREQNRLAQQRHRALQKAAAA